MSETPRERRFAGRTSPDSLRRLHKCERQLWLDRHAPQFASPPSEFDRERFQRGRDHEAAVRERFTNLVGPILRRDVSFDEAARETVRRLTESRAPLYQAVVISKDGSRVGVPDFLYWDGEDLVILDAKTAHNLRAHPEIAIQLSFYARLLEESAGITAARLEIVDGRGDLREVAAIADRELDDWIRRAESVLRSEREPDVLLAHSTCEECAFYGHCWDAAERAGDPRVLPSVQRRFVPALESLGLTTIAKLAAADPERLTIKGAGKLAASMVREARAFAGGRAEWIAPARLPAGRPLVWFDLEAEPEAGAAGSSVYLWGLAIERDGAAPFEAIFARGGADGEEAAWREFVARAAAILDAHPRCVWVHYTPYERTWVRKYADVFGAPDGLIERLDRAMWDLHAEGIVPCVRLPLRSLSIKKVARFAGFEWRNPEAGSQWSIVQYRRALAADGAERDRLLHEIAEYNEDDLLAMRAVWRWMEREAPRG